MVYYLKINRNEAYTIKNLEHWLETVSIDREAKTFILCDSENVRALVKDTVEKYSVEYIESFSDNSEVRGVVRGIADERWENAAFAHLTTFFHARDNGFNEFWNIDADDTLICLNDKRTYECLDRAREYAKAHGIDVFSLDMWASKTGGMHWSFGITYTNNTKKWIDTIKRYSSDDYKDKNQPMNIDGRFSIIKKNEGGIGTFYFENMTFLHYSNDFMRRPCASGVYRWNNGRMLSPVLKYVFGMTAGGVDIPDDVVRLDMGIKDDETQEFLVENCYLWDRSELKRILGE